MSEEIAIHVWVVAASLPVHRSRAKTGAKRGADMLGRIRLFAHRATAAR